MERFGLPGPDPRVVQFAGDRSRDVANHLPHDGAGDPGRNIRHGIGDQAVEFRRGEFLRVEPGQVEEPAGCLDRAAVCYPGVEIHEQPPLPFQLRVAFLAQLAPRIW